MAKITLHVTPVEAQLIRLALCTISIASVNFVKADRLQWEIGQAVALHELAQKNIKRTKRS
jgi:hypothetical protein